MKLVRDFEGIENFNFWGEAVNVYNSLTYEEIAFINSFLEDLEELSDMDLNDFLWFEAHDFLIEHDLRNE